MNLLDFLCLGSKHMKNLTFGGESFSRLFVGPPKPLEKQFWETFKQIVPVLGFFLTSEFTDFPDPENQALRAGDLINWGLESEAGGKLSGPRKSSITCW